MYSKGLYTYLESLAGLLFVMFGVILVTSQQVGTLISLFAVQSLLLNL